MRKAELVRAGEDLYEVIHKISAFKFSTDISGDKADILKQWFGAEKILRNPQTNEYLFVNLIPQLDYE